MFILQMVHCYTPIFVNNVSHNVTAGFSSLQQQPSLSLKFFGVGYGSLVRGRPHVFISAILFYLKSYSLYSIIYS